MTLMTDIELQRLGAMGNALRPDWPARSLVTFIERSLRGRAYGDVAVALAWVATRTKTETPRLILEAGPWWKAAATEQAHVQRPPRKQEECRKHPGNWHDSCVGCAGDKLAGDDSTFNPRRTEAPATVVQLVRANLTQAKAGLCVHGVHPKLCKDRSHDEPTHAEPEETA